MAVIDTEPWGVAANPADHLSALCERPKHCVDVLESADGTVAMWISFFLAQPVYPYQSARSLHPDVRHATKV
jgi:hypothetical protein